jgi:hypothetical protein
MLPLIAVGVSYGASLESTLLTGAFIGYGLSTLDYDISSSENYLGSIFVQGHSTNYNDSLVSDFFNDINYNLSKINPAFSTSSILALGLLSSKHSTLEEDEIIVQASSSSIDFTNSFAIPAKDFELNPNSTLMLEYKSIMDEIAKKEAELAFIRMTTERISVEKSYTDKDLLILLESLDVVNNQSSGVIALPQSMLLEFPVLLDDIVPLAGGTTFPRYFTDKNSMLQEFPNVQNNELIGTPPAVIPFPKTENLEDVISKQKSKVEEKAKEEEESKAKEEAKEEDLAKAKPKGKAKKKDIEEYKTNIVAALKPKTIYNTPNITLTAPTKAKLKDIGQLHEDCINKYQGLYDEAQPMITQYQTALNSAYNMPTTVYVSPSYTEDGRMISSGSYVYSSTLASKRTDAINSATSSLNSWKSASNEALDLLVLCSDNRKKDIVALLDALLDTCMPCSEIKKTLIEAYGDVVTDEFDTICNEHDELRKIPTNCCLKVLCNPCSYRYEP